MCNENANQRTLNRRPPTPASSGRGYVQGLCVVVVCVCVLPGLRWTYCAPRPHGGSAAGCTTHASMRVSQHTRAHPQQMRKYRAATASLLEHMTVRITAMPPRAHRAGSRPSASASMKAFACWLARVCVCVDSTCADPFRRRARGPCPWRDVHRASSGSAAPLPYCNTVVPTSTPEDSKR